MSQVIFARECTKPKVENNQVRAMVPVGNNGNNNRDTPQNVERAMVAQQFTWEEQLQALNLSAEENANLAQVQSSQEVEEAEEKMMDLQFAFMVSTTPNVKEVSENSCPGSCVNKLKNLKIHNDNLLRENRRT